MKLSDLALLIVLFIIATFLLSIFNFISITLIDILSYSLLIIGIALVYSETVRQNRLSVFIGSIIFLSGVYFLITENFNLNISEGMSIPLIMIFAGLGLLVLHISTSTKIIFLIISIVFTSAGLILLIVYSHWSFGSFLLSVLPILNYLWPVLIILFVLVILVKNK
jgi:hypothetical protein